MPLTIVPLGLELGIRVGLTRQKRGRCPVCGNRRVLFRLTAFGLDIEPQPDGDAVIHATGQAVGFGVAKCLEDAGIRLRATEA